MANPYEKRLLRLLDHMSLMPWRLRFILPRPRPLPQYLATKLHLRIRQIIFQLMQNLTKNLSRRSDMG